MDGGFTFFKTSFGNDFQVKHFLFHSFCCVLSGSVRLAHLLLEEQFCVFWRRCRRRALEAGLRVTDDRFVKEGSFNIALDCMR